jgi:hypothetical protein
VCWKSCSSCWSFHLLRGEFLSAPIHAPPLSGSPYRSFTSTTADGEDRSAEAREPTLPPQAGAVVELVLEEATLVEGMLHATTSSHHGG